nr:reverse transcriptase domain-containing protein [Tanacetum cinerariifolium]
MNNRRASYAKWLYDRPINYEVEAKLRSFLVENDDRILGIQVCAYKDGKVTIDTSAGVLGIDDPRPVQPDSLFNVCSVTKGITAGIIHWLANKGYVPSTVHGMFKFPTEEGIVTIRSSLLIPAECASVDTSSVTLGEKKARPANLTVPLHPNFPDQEVVVGGLLSDKGRTELCSLLKKNLDIFAWQPSDMTGVPRSVAEHGLNVRKGCPPVRQKKRGQAPERTKAIQAEVEKLVEAGIMREVFYHDWLSNPVMVRKHDGSWRMYVDFTDLNKACPQDCYPLPEIDWKVKSLSTDEEKTAFHTGQGVYRYTKMPFGLKNAVATYQRLMDKAFENQMGAKHRAEGVFLRYVITPEGIKPCPDKMTAVLQLPSPQTIKEVQSLNGKLASLNRTSVPAVETTFVSSPSVGRTQTTGRADHVFVRYSWSH